jgi:hypothetical protein
MLILQIDGITGGTSPYNLYACDAYGNQCAILATLTGPVPPPSTGITLNIPSQFNNVPVIGIKIVDSNGCEQFILINCGAAKGKIYQSGEVFLFMEGNIYIFEDQ